MAGLRIPAYEHAYKPRFLLMVVLGLTMLLGGRALPQQPPGPAPKGATSPPPAKKADPDLGHVQREKKLILKDGTYQLVREYQRNGDRVRYFSAERGDWEEIPASMIDWDATGKDEAARAKADATLVEKVHQSDEAKKMDAPLDIDASLPVAEGVYLPTGEGLFVLEGKTVRLLQQVGSETKADKLRTIEQVLSPIPVVPGKLTVTIPGNRASLRLRSSTPEFYLREAPEDPDRVSAVKKSSRPGENGPDVVLVRAKIVHNGRQLESISTLFGEEMNTNRNEVMLQRWEVAQGLYRFTLGEALTPGEYAIAEVLPDGLNYYVWDFGVDGAEDKKK
ncbi:MAG TPA: hypothetical protein VMT75_11980 [Candidatus Saccharimonadales bacterium]|nr:hypothetical protein [Candidatus Saccharimonadales bacterium]